MFRKNGFTIIELLVLVVIIGILALITIVSYSGITDRASDAKLAFDLKNAATKLKAYHATYGSYPASLDAAGCPVASGSLPADANYCVKTSQNNSIYTYSASGQTFSISLVSSTNKYIQSTESVSQASFTPSQFIQTVTTANCPSSRTKVQDARDRHTYWVQKLADGKCWTLTNLAYAGGGTNTYGDVKTINLTTQWSNDYTTAYYIQSPYTTSVFTFDPTSPSSNTDGTGQYGYLYNGCAAQGTQVGTTACANISTPLSSASISICPSGWVLPNYNSNWLGLITNINSNLSTDVGLRNTWLLVYSGFFNGIWQAQNYGYFWTNEYFSYGYLAAYATNNFVAGNSSSSPSAVANFMAVRCLAI